MVEWEWKYDLLKINPLARWERRDVWDYIQAHQVPYNRLHEQGYPSVGCTHCTQQVPGAKVTDYSRSGRWAGQTKSECGLHGYGI
ncbi:MAG: phosphoadenosine phosphosulfate reductase family protein [Phycisphaerae bacterium]